MNDTPKCFVRGTPETVSLVFPQPIDRLDMDYDQVEKLAACLLKKIGQELKPVKKRRAPAKPKQEMDDDQYLDWLQEQEAYKHLNVRRINSRMQVWCAERGNQGTRRRLLNWLNREDKPIGNGNGQTTNGAAQTGSGSNYGRPSRTDIIRKRDYSIFAEPEADDSPGRSGTESGLYWEAS